MKKLVLYIITLNIFRLKNIKDNITINSSNISSKEKLKVSNRKILLYVISYFTVTFAFLFSTPAIAAPNLNSLPTDITVVEDTPTNLNLSAAIFTNPGSGGASQTVTLAVGTGTLSATSGGGVVIGGSNTSTITLTGTVTNIDTYLNTVSNIQYTGASNLTGNNADLLTVTAIDGGINVFLDSANIDIQALNDDPTLTGLPSDITVIEDTLSNIDLSVAIFSDVDAGGANVTLTIAAGTGTLSATSGGGVVIAGSNTSIITLTGTATNIDTYLNTVSNIQYTGASNLTGNNADSLTVSANDGGNTGIGGGANISFGSVNIDISAVNDDPTLTGLPSDITVVEDTLSNINLSVAIFSDVDAGGANVTLTIVAGTGTLSATSGGGVVIAGSNTSTITLTGTATNIDSYLNTVSNIQYTGVSNLSGNNVDLLTVTANDGGNTGIGGGANVSLGSANIDIQALNDDPTLIGLPSDITVIEDTLSNIDLSVVIFSDVDAGGANITLTIAAGTGTLSATSGGGVVIGGSNTSTITLTGTATNIDTYLNTVSNIQYTGASNLTGNNADSLTVTANDGGNTGIGGGANISFGSVNIDISAVNDDPTFTGLPSDITVIEDTLSNINLSVAIFSDVDAGGANVTLTIAAGTGTLSATSGGGVVIGGSNTSTITLTGTATNIDTYLNTVSNIQYTGASNLSGNNADLLTLTANDGGNTGAGGGANVSLGSANIDISAVNDDPIITGLPTDVSVAENSPSDINLTLVNLSDVDAGGASIILKLSAGTGTLSAISGGGVTIGGNLTSTLTLTGSAANITSFINILGNIQYTGAVTVVGNNADILSIIVNDGGNIGVGGGIDINLGNINMDITSATIVPVPIFTPIGLIITLFGLSVIGLRRKKYC